MGMFPFKSNAVMGIGQKQPRIILIPGTKICTKPKFGEAPVNACSGGVEPGESTRRAAVQVRKTRPANGCQWEEVDIKRNANLQGGEFSKSIIHSLSDDYWAISARADGWHLEGAQFARQ
jgi:hypothetical protein